MKHYYIGNCRICNQGMLEIVKEEDSNVLFVECDECEAEWKNPEDALNKKNGGRNQYSKSIGTCYDEIKLIKWDKYLI